MAEEMGATEELDVIWEKMTWDERDLVDSVLKERDKPR